MDSDKIEISIIIPFYNVEGWYLERCLNSIFESTFKNFEIIIVNDGSSAERTKALEGICEKYNKILVVSKSNGGVSDARNYGMRFVKGDFIVYVDPDDAITKDFLYEAYETIQSEQSDIVMGGCVSVPTEYNYRNFTDSYPISPKTLERRDFDKFRNSFMNNPIRRDNIYMGPGCWARIIRKDLAKKTPFVVGIKISEDRIWNQSIFNKADRITLVLKGWYFHYVNGESVTHVYNEGNIEIIRNFSTELIKNVDLNDRDVYVVVMKDIYGHTRCYICQNYLTNVNCRLKYRERVRIFNNLLKSYPWSLLDKRFFKSVGLGWKLKYILYKLHLLFPLFYIIDSYRQRKGSNLT